MLIYNKIEFRHFYGRSLYMLKNYLLIAWRNILRRPFYTTLNLVGISAAILFILLIGAFAGGELQVNRQLRNAGRLYYLNSEWKESNEGLAMSTLGPLSKRLKEEYPTLVADYFRGDYITSVVSRGDKHFREHIDVGDSTFFSMF